MKHYTCIHSDKNLAIFACLPYSFHFLAALKGCSSLRAYFKHFGTSMEQEKFFKSSIVFHNHVRFNHLYNFRYFFVFSFKLITA